MREMGLVFQERGGPRPVSGEPMEETIIAASSGAEIAFAARRRGMEVSNAL
jgi:hypothetical protein